MKNILFVASWLIFCIHSLVSAQTGPQPVRNPPLAFARPVRNISVDGDISDWPRDFTMYPMQSHFWKKSSGPEDISAYFLTGYNIKARAVYFAVVVTDDSHVISDSTKTGPDLQDSYTLYLDANNKPEGSGVAGYRFTGLNRWLPELIESWDPEIRKAGWDNVRTAARTKGNTTIYECSVVLKDKVFAGKAIGADHLVTDKDSDDPGSERSYLGWGSRDDKAFSPGRIGYILLLKSGERVSEISGRLKWDNDTISKYPEKIRITSLTNPALQVQVPVDSTGAYSVSLPAGKYKISNVWIVQRYGDDIYRLDDKASEVTVESNGKNVSVAPLLVLRTLKAPDLIPEKGIMFDFNVTRAQQLDDFVKAYRDYYQIPGVSLALLKDGKVLYYKAYGVKNNYTGEPVDDSTLFEAASITKTVFAYAVNRLAERGVIDLDRPLYQYLPFEELAYDDRYMLMTARHVLSHQTGLPNWAYNEPDGKLRLKFAPGTGYGYSGEGFEYLKRVVMKITGKDINTVLDEEVISPLGLHKVCFSANSYLQRVAAYGHYERYPTRSSLPQSPGMAWSMYTEAKSFSEFVIALQNRKGMRPETYDELFRYQSTVPLDEEEKARGLDLHYGLGIALEMTPFGFVFEHGGNNGDFRCQFMMYRDLNMGFVIFTNSDAGGTLAYDDIARFLITGKGKR